MNRKNSNKQCDIIVDRKRKTTTNMSIKIGLLFLCFAACRCENEVPPNEPIQIILRFGAVSDDLKSFLPQRFVLNGFPGSGNRISSNRNDLTIYKNSHETDEDIHRIVESTHRTIENTYKPEESTYKPEESTYKPDGSTYRPIESTHKPDENIHRPDGNATGIGIVVWALSILVLIANAFIAYAYLPGMERIRKFILISHVTCLFFAFIGFFVFRVGYVDVSNPKNLRIISAYSINFSFLASYFWISVLCFDIWWTLGVSPLLYNKWKQLERERFIVYAIYVWGCTVILTSICLTVDYTPGILGNIPKPLIGLEGCWFQYNMAKIIYFYAPIAVTTFFNIILYSLCVLKLRHENRNTSNHSECRDNQRREEDNEYLSFFSILFIIIVINCSTEIIWSTLCDE